MEKPTREAIARYLAGSREPYAVTARRLNISVSSLRRVASEFGIFRRKRLDGSVMDAIRRVVGSLSEVQSPAPVNSQPHVANNSLDANDAATVNRQGGNDAEL